MSTRRYVSSVRTVAAAAKRDRVIEAAARSLRENASIASFSLEAVAKAAGVTRLTVYHQFGSRRGLLEAVFDDIARQGGLTEIAHTMEMPDPRAALDRLVEIFCAFWNRDPAVGRLHEAMATDPEFAQALGERNERRRKAFKVLVGRIAAKSVSPRARRDAVDLIFALTSLAMFAMLSRECSKQRGWHPKKIRLPQRARSATVRHAFEESIMNMPTHLLPTTVVGSYPQPDDEELAMAFADAVNAEALDLQKAGADVIQLDEPWVRNNPELAKRHAVKAINRALAGITVPTVVHLCFGYAAVVPGSTKPSGYSFLAELADTSAEQISIEAAQPKLDLGVLKDLSSKKITLGVLDLGNPEIETVDVVAGRIRHGLKYVAAERLIPAPDCGMKYMPRHIAFGKLKAMCDAAAMVRKELS